MSLHKNTDCKDSSINKIDASEERLIQEVTMRLAEEARIRTHYYVKVGVTAFLCALFLAFGIPVFMASRITGSLSYTALGIVLIAFGMVLAIAVIVLLFKPFRPGEK